MTLTPAYGRDYKSQAKLLEDFNNNKDFLRQDLVSQLINKQQIPAGTRIQFRYGKLRKTFIHTV
jgi:hypothetical protein